MLPKLHISVFKYKIHSFHFFGILGFVSGITMGVILSIQLHLHPGIILLMAAVGAATFFLLAFAAKWITGEETIVYYHHEIAILVFCTLTLYLLKLPVLTYLDITILGIGVFLACGRIGCYSVGCCHGRPHKHGVKYGQQHVDAGFTWFYKDIPLLPVQLIESVYVFLTVITSIILLFNHAAPGTVLIVYTVVYGLMRFTLEFLRGDPERPLLGGLSEAQLTTLALTAITFVMGQIDWLPVYNWHWMILVVMGIASLITIYKFNKNTSEKLFTAPHIRQLAEGLTMLEEVNAKPVTGNKKPINVYRTKHGFSVSCSNSNEQEKHFTISFKNKTALKQPVAEKMAGVIGTLKNYKEGFELIEKQNGIYHILFKETVIVKHSSA